MQGPTSHDWNFHQLRLQKQSLTTPPLGCRVHHAARAMRHWELAATQWTEFGSNHESPTSPGESCTRLPAGLQPHQHLWCYRQSTCNAQKGTVGIKNGNLLLLHLQVAFTNPTICNCLFRMFGLSMLPDVVKETAVTIALSTEKNTASNGLTNWPNIATKFAKRGTMRSLLLSNWSSGHRAVSAMHWTEFDSNQQRSTSPGESFARLPAGLPPQRHWCHRGSTWSAQKRTVGIYSPCGKMAYRKSTFMPSIPKSSKNLAFMGGKAFYHLNGAKFKIYYKLRKILA